MNKIKFVGHNTSKTIKYEEYAESYKELAYKLLERNIVHYDELDEYIFKKYDVSSDDFVIDGEWNEDKYNEFMNQVTLNEQDYRAFIGGCDGNAYYQEFYVYSTELQEYVKD